MAIAFVKNGGVIAAKGGAGSSQALTVPAGGHAIGNLVVVAVGSWSTTPTLNSVTDTGTNTYTILEAATPAVAGRLQVAASVLTTALAAGNTITATLSGAQTAIAVSSMEFSGATITEDVASTTGSAGANTTASAGPITPPSAAVLLVGAAMFENAGTITEDADSAGGDTWHSGPLSQTTGGGAGSNIVSRMAYKITTSSVAQTYNPSFSVSGTLIVSLVALQATAVAGVTVIPVGFAVGRDY